ncbi:plastocyanin/azurin family copper-binding protein [Modestobacter sp. VKM Ac-2986]|uniref:plastocyanin/azurin family copper-binding protein n=1 Tax=Modestobacter sp. VKM Ac-2986 TaxID=3004140 RepID=UPI0022AB5EB4|nr:plastocyanin/azurin family copper-binding protein [Modestobacter sp. VKM Ac-2986]MCZ2829960.1 plastocyanin/azurin family copper-binding protein [Modestobacter sp. VKM Ac-2986]
MNSAADRTRGARRTTPRRGPAGALLSGALVLAVLTGCSNSEPTLPEVTRATSADAGVVSTAPDGVQEITLETGDDYAFTPAAFTVAPGPVRLTVRNTAEQLTHNFLFTKGKGPADIAEQIPFLGPGDSKTIEFTAGAPGDYPFECSFHLALGQVGTMTVSAP